MLPQIGDALLTFGVGIGLVLGFVVFVVLFALQRRHAAYLAALPVAPTVDDLREFGYDRGICVAALKFLEAEKAAGRLDYYRPIGGARADWNVWVNHAIDPATGYHGRRLHLGDWTHDFIVGTLPAAGGAQ